MIIGLTGYAQSGKDTVASILVEQYGFTRVAFADKIREFLYETGPDYLRYLVDEVGWEKAKQNKTVREMLQNTGVGARKVFGEDFWIYEALKNVESTKNYVITDVRFINEAVWIRETYDGLLWRIRRTGVTAVNSHVSESQMNGYSVDQTFLNNGTIEDLSESIKARMVGLLV
jgi:hypothetical protein